MSRLSKTLSKSSEFSEGPDKASYFDKPLMAFRVRQFWRTRLFWLLHLVSQFRRFGLLAVRSRFIGEALALDAQQRLFCAGGIVEA
jgi:hypothetical protein